MTNFSGMPTIETLPSVEHEVVLGAFEQVAGEFQRLLAHHFRGFVDGVAGDHRAAAGEGAGAPIELIGIAGDDVDIGDLDAELLGGDLGKHREMPLALGADAGGDR